MIWKLSKLEIIFKIDFLEFHGSNLIIHTMTKLHTLKQNKINV